jgi:hypothetical protein
MTAGGRVTLVWAVLVLATMASWLASDEAGGRWPSAAMLAVLAIAMLKIRLIGMHFMDLRTAPVGLRRWFTAYVLVVFTVLAVIGLTV